MAEIKLEWFGTPGHLNSRLEPMTDRATVTALENMLEEAFGRLEDLIDSADAEDGCEHEDQVCWNCRQRMFVLTLLPVLESCCAKAVREEREACAMLHESVPNECDRDLHKLTVTGCGCGAMGAVIAYRDAIRKRGQRG